MQSTIPAQKFSVALASVAVILTILSFIHDLAKLYWNDTLNFLSLFEVHAEGTIPVWFSVANLLLAATLLGIIASAVKARHLPFASHWMALSIIFVGLSIDEMLALHERLIEPLRNTLNTSGFLNSAWVIIAIPFVIVLVAAYTQFLRSLPSRIRWGLIFSGIIFISGAIGIEMFNAYYVDIVGQDTVYFFFTNFEDLCEMIGVIFLIYNLLTYIYHHNGLQFRFSA